MKRYTLKIKTKLLEGIKQGLIKHDFRINNEINKSIKPNDIIHLVSNDNKENIDVLVKSRTEFDTWNEAFSCILKDNYSSFFKTQEEAKKAFYKSYKHHRYIKFLNLVCFEIEYIPFSLKNLNLLLDTDVILSAYKNNDFNLDKLNSYFKKFNCKTFIHESSEKEIKSYNKPYEKINRKLINKTPITEKDITNKVLKSEEILKPYTVFNKTFDKYDMNYEEIVYPYGSRANVLTSVDNDLLYEVYTNKVDGLITTNLEILKNAKKLNIEHKVFTPLKLLTLFENTYPEEINYDLSTLQLVHLKDINFEDPFFDSIKNDYSEFNDWTLKTGEKQAYVYKENNKIYGFLYLKAEKAKEIDSEIKPELDKFDRLKLGYFKIDENNMFGFNLAEMFLKIILDRALIHDSKELYIILNEKREENIKLINYLTKWGFTTFGTKNENIVLMKQLLIYKKRRGKKYNFPLLNKNIRYHFLKIDNDYFSKLFPIDDIVKDNINLHKENDEFAHPLEKTCLINADYIKESYSKDDVVIIYKNGSRFPKDFSSLCTSFCLIESIKHVQSLKQCIQLCKNNSIYKIEDIVKLYSKDSVVVKLLYIKPIVNKITLEKLKEYEFVKNNNEPSQFEQIEYNKYFNILNEY